jgi:hypothetical protein
MVNTYDILASDRYYNFLQPLIISNQYKPSNWEDFIHDIVEFERIDILSATFEKISINDISNPETFMERICHASTLKSNYDILSFILSIPLFKDTFQTGYNFFTLASENTDLRFLSTFLNDPRFISPIRQYPVRLLHALQTCIDVENVHAFGLLLEHPKTERFIDEECIKEVIKTAKNLPVLPKLLRFGKVKRVFDRDYIEIYSEI